MGRTRGAGTGGVGNSQSSVLPSDGETAQGQAEEMTDRQHASGRQIPGAQGFGQGWQSVKSFSGGGGRTSDPVEPTE